MGLLEWCSWPWLDNCRKVRREQRRVTTLRVVLRDVVEERLWRGNAPPNEPTKRRKMAGVRAFGRANKPGVTTGVAPTITTERDLVDC